MLTALLALTLLFFPSDTTSAQDPPAQAQLLEAVRAYAGPFEGSSEVVGLRTEWADLTGDGVLDAVVYLDSPSWCGSGGCTVLVFETITGDEAIAELGAFRPAAEVSLMHGPVIVAETATGGWADLIVQGSDGAPVVLLFDGETYPASPAEGVAVATSPSGTVLFAGTR